MSHPALHIHEPRLGQWLALEGDQRIQAMNEAARAQQLRNAFGRPLRFVAAGEALAAVDYEEAIAGGTPEAEEGLIATRLSGSDGLHDLFNALAWLRWPQTKAALNAFHVAEIGAARAGTGPTRSRSRARDRVTLFDENGALLLCRDERVFERLRLQDWPGLFISGRALLQQAELQVVGHGLMHKCLQPFKAMTARVLCLPLAPDTPTEQVDQAMAQVLRADWPHWRLPPLPVCGWPGWAAQDQDERFYRDPAVFRPPRRPGPAADGAATAPP